MKGLPVGTRLGPYEILAELGRGGMGEVYRATDTNLKRQVAIKVLPESLAGDADRLMRFQREAEVLAALNHPNIAQIYGLERTAGTTALVMELVEGRDLSEVLAGGAEAHALHITEALAIARQIIDALEAAHEQGIVHRDLKPANIKVREDRTVKVLDFGLAKAMEPDGAGSSADVANSPTLTARATQIGLILGTASYMSPEQARGRPVDKRTDVWAFGCVLFEMLTGRKAFHGEDVTEIISAVVKTEPEWSALPATVPSQVRTVIERCLTKDRKKRIPDLSVVRYLLDETTTMEAADAGAVAAPVRSVRVWQAVAAALLLTILAGGTAWYRGGTADHAESTDVMQFTLAPTGETGLSLLPARVNHVAISPDGRLLVYQGGDGTDGFLVIRRFDETEGVTLRGSEGGADPFFSPDSAFVGFMADNQRTVKKVSVTGGTAREVARLEAGRVNGATWTDDGLIILGVEGSSNRPLAGLYSVSAEGGPIRFDNLDEGTNIVRPSAIPGTRMVLYVSSLGAPGVAGQLMVWNRDTEVATSLGIDGVNPMYLPSGHLLYANWDGAVLAVPFDVDQQAVTGAPVQVLERVQRNASGSADFSVSRQGHLVYVAGEAVSNEGALVWVTPEGVEEPIAAPVREYRSVRVSPDGNYLLVDIDESSRAQASLGSRSRIWLWDLKRPSLLRPWATDSASETPVWSADGTRVVYSDGPGLYARMADGTGDAVALIRGTEGRRTPHVVSPDGQVVFSYARGPGTQRDLRVVSLNGDHTVTPLIQTDEAEHSATLSPDGRWMAYTQRQGQVNAVLARPFADAGGAPIPVSTDQGQAPVWSRDGKHIYY